MSTVTDIGTCKTTRSRVSGCRVSTLRMRERLLDEARAVIVRELHNSNLKIQDVAAAMFVSERNLQRVFFSAGTSFREELLKARVYAAAEILEQNPSIRIGDLTTEVGYLEQSRLAANFKRFLGMTPTDYKADCYEQPAFSDICLTA
jgi:AraC-like DNA-binding protein